MAIDWTIDVDPYRTKDDRVAMLRHDEASPFSRLTDRELAELTLESHVWTVSQFLHGEQGALLATAKIVDCVPDNDAKLYAATQVMDQSITLNVMGDEARHVGFGIASLEGLYDDMPEAERKDREEFVCEAAELMRDRFLQREVWEHFGLPADDCEQYVRDHAMQQAFRKALFSKVVPNVKRIGLLTPYVRARFEQLGILQFENAPASA